MPQSMPLPFIDALELAHPSWRATLRRGLAAIAEANPDYLPELADDHYLPTKGRLFAAFSLPFDAVRFVLVGEGPYPRMESATGVCFMDGAVEALWSENGLSKQVNRATSLRNFMKMLLVADGQLSEDDTSSTAVTAVARHARTADSPHIQTLTELQANLLRRGFLLLNATLVYRPNVPPLKDAKAWKPFLEVVLGALLEREKASTPTLVLWGKIAEQLVTLNAIGRFPKAVSEHPYNLSFIRNRTMQDLFRPMHLLRRAE